MNLEEVFQNPVSSLIHLERYVNKGSPSGFTFKNTSSCPTRPACDFDFFLLPLYEVQRNLFTYFGDTSRLPENLTSYSSEVDIYPIHPDIEDAFLEELDSRAKLVTKIKVVPTASVRTVLFLESEDLVYIKLHYPRIIGRFNRGNPYNKWISSHQNNEELKAYLNSSACPISFALMDEYAGKIVAVNRELNEGMGVIFRDFNPIPIKASTCLIPFFSLFSKDSMGKNDELLFLQVLNWYDQSPLEFAEKIVVACLECFQFQALELGLIPEYNAQNVLLEISINDNKIRLVHRDMMGTFIDLTLRMKKGLHQEFNPYHSIDINENRIEYFRRRSFAYDFKLGEYMFKEIEGILSKCFKISPIDFRSMVRNQFKKIIKVDPAEYFGSNDKWYSYEKVMPGGKRPYKECSNPKYR